MSKLKFRLVQIPIYVIEIVAIIMIILIARIILSPAYEESIAEVYVIDGTLTVIAWAIATIPFIIYGFVHLLLFLYGFGSHKIWVRLFFAVFFLAITFAGVFAFLVFLAVNVIHYTTVDTLLELEEVAATFSYIMDTLPLIHEYDDALTTFTAIHVIATVIAAISSCIFGIIARKTFTERAEAALIKAAEDYSELDDDFDDDDN
ncbi:MAG: hypothetical protein FWG68_08110 [Defluviitaleaceae bacterium]|nr:hypothetical protein [Defluviitaleaceae bacterium]